MQQLFYRPKDGVAADFIPFYENGVYHLFYLKDYRDSDLHGEGTPWFHIATSDFLRFEDHGEALPRGAREEQDLWVFTGSVIHARGEYHIFYTGHNNYFPKEGRPQEAIMHAVSSDLDHWKKIPEDTFYPDAARYEKNDFRDPFVFFNEEKNRFEMLLVSRRQNCGMTAGFTALYASEDLKRWTDEGVFWGPDLYHTHECPDLFYQNGWWYLIYSEYSDQNTTRYVMSPTLSGPWQIPEDDAFDGRGYYAAKTAGDGQNRCLFGWIPTKTGEQDMGGWQWGGDLAVHQLIQRPDGTLGCRLPDSIRQRAAVCDRMSVPQTLCAGPGRKDLLLFSHPGRCLLDLTLSFSGPVKAFGVTLNEDFSAKLGYKYEFTPARNTLHFDAISRQINRQGLSRPVLLKPGEEIHLSLLIEGEAAVLYVNGEIALSARMYDVAGADIGVYAVAGEVTVRQAVLSEIPLAES